MCYYIHSPLSVWLQNFFDGGFKMFVQRKSLHFVNLMQIAGVPVAFKTWWGREKHVCANDLSFVLMAPLLLL